MFHPVERSQRRIQFLARRLMMLWALMQAAIHHKEGSGKLPPLTQTATAIPVEKRNSTMAKPSPDGQIFHEIFSLYVGWLTIHSHGTGDDGD